MTKQRVWLRFLLGEVQMFGLLHSVLAVVLCALWPAALPFSLLLPYVNLFWTAALSVVIGLVIASAFSAILVYAQQLVPGRVGAISGLFFGFAFGVAGIGAALLGMMADWKGAGHPWSL